MKAKICILLSILLLFVFIQYLLFKLFTLIALDNRLLGFLLDVIIHLLVVRYCTLKFIYIGGFSLFKKYIMWLFNKSYKKEMSQRISMFFNTTSDLKNNTRLDRNFISSYSKLLENFYLAILHEKKVFEKIKSFKEEPVIITKLQSKYLNLVSLFKLLL